MARRRPRCLRRTPTRRRHRSTGPTGPPRGVSSRDRPVAPRTDAGRVHSPDTYLHLNLESSAHACTALPIVVNLSRRRRACLEVRRTRYLASSRTALCDAHHDSCTPSHAGHTQPVALVEGMRSDCRDLRRAPTRKIRQWTWPEGALGPGPSCSTLD